MRSDSGDGARWKRKSSICTDTRGRRRCIYFGCKKGACTFLQLDENGGTAGVPLWCLSDSACIWRSGSVVLFLRSSNFALMLSGRVRAGCVTCICSSVISIYLMSSLCSSFAPRAPPWPHMRDCELWPRARGRTGTCPQAQAPDDKHNKLEHCYFWCSSSVANRDIYMTNPYILCARTSAVQLHRAGLTREKKKEGDGDHLPPPPEKNTYLSHISIYLSPYTV